MQLTTKQEKILSLAASGLKDRLIADKMGLSVRTVQNHLARIYTKIHTNNRVAGNFALYAIQMSKSLKGTSPQSKKQNTKKEKNIKGGKMGNFYYNLQGGLNTQLTPVMMGADTQK